MQCRDNLCLLYRSLLERRKDLVSLLLKERSEHLLLCLQGGLLISQVVPKRCRLLLLLLQLQRELLQAT